MTATVRTDDLGKVLDYLEGLHLMLEQFDTGTPGEDPRAHLLARLREMDSDGSVWEPLRYGQDAGGWKHVAINVGDLREHLLSSYANAALPDPEVG